MQISIRFKNAFIRQKKTFGKYGMCDFFDPYLQFNRRAINALPPVKPVGNGMSRDQNNFQSYTSAYKTFLVKIFKY